MAGMSLFSFLKVDIFQTIIGNVLLYCLQFLRLLSLLFTTHFLMSIFKKKLRHNIQKSSHSSSRSQVVLSSSKHVMYIPFCPHVFIMSTHEDDDVDDDDTSPNIKFQQCQYIMYTHTIHVIMTMKTVSHVGIIVVGHIIFFKCQKTKLNISFYVRNERNLY